MKALFSATLISAVMIAGCTPETTGGSASVSMDAARSVSTVEEFLSLGGRQLTEAEFKAELVDVTLAEGTWTWTIHGDGTHDSAANDGSWKDQGGTWRLVDGRYCRVGGSGGREQCSAAYRLGSIYRFADSDNASQLSGWSVTRG